MQEGRVIYPDNNFSLSLIFNPMGINIPMFFCVHKSLTYHAIFTKTWEYNSNERKQSSKNKNNCKLCHKSVLVNHAYTACMQKLQKENWLYTV